jgi:hypothetical protein
MTHICEDCGMIAVANLDENKYACPNEVTCKNSNIYMIEIPYAAKLLFQVTYVYMCTHVCVYMYVCVYIFIYK